MEEIRRNMAEIHTLKATAFEYFEMQHYMSDTAELYKARRYPPHIHDCVEFYVLLDGDVSFMVEDSVYRLTTGDVLVSKPNEMHNCVLNSNSVHKHLCFWFTPPSHPLLACFAEGDFGANNLISLPEQQKEELLDICRTLHKASEDKDELKVLYSSLHFLHLLQTGAKELQTERPRQPLPPTLQNILSDVNKNFTKIRSLDYFTEKYFISQSTLQRLFKKYLHTTPKLYIETKRLAYSRVLLKQGLSVFDACMQAGFPDYSNYVQLFKRRFCITPKRYRDE